MTLHHKHLPVVDYFPLTKCFILTQLLLDQICHQSRVCYRAAYFNDIAVGAVCCRVDHSQNQKRLYIMTLGCLAPYRRLGIGTVFFTQSRAGMNFKSHES